MLLKKNHESNSPYRQYTTPTPKPNKTAPIAMESVDAGKSHMQAKPMHVNTAEIPREAALRAENTSAIAHETTRETANPKRKIR